MATVANRKSAGMALVITLILLSVTLVMIIALLAVARRERASVGTSADATTARLASDTALAAAQAQIIANLKGSTNAALFSYGMLVSTNYVNWLGYQPLIQSPTNVNYFYRYGGGALNGADFLQNVANLQILPRAPVMVSAAEPMGRYYLDLNRNSVFDGTGHDTNGVVLNEVGDPEWVGLLQNPGATHSADNKFLSRYAFIALPVGQTLDLNYIHNAARMPSVTPFNYLGSDFRRNQGVGSWEINLAAFFTDLNTNIYAWNAPTYTYDPIGGFVSGTAFADAAATYAFRLNGLHTGNTALDYAYNVTALPSASYYFGNPTAFNAASSDLIDIYSDGPLQTTTAAPVNNDSSDVNYPWPGSSVTNLFYSLADYFDPLKTSVGFTNRLVAAGNSTNEYDRYTFYRLLQELGTDSLPADAGKLNLNYSNAVVTYGNNGVFQGTSVISGAETNLISWRPLDFFCAAADMMLKTYTTNWFQADPSNYLATYYGINYLNANTAIDHGTGFGLTNAVVGTNTIPAFGLANIPVYVNGRFVYSPAVNRLLQLAANIYDASTTNYFPSVFKPILRVTNNPNGYANDVSIIGFEFIPDTSGYWAGTNFYGFTPLTPPTNVTDLVVATATDQNVFGVPWIIGAKKGFPNFNKFGMQNVVQVARKLQIKRSTVPTVVNSTTFWTNQLLVFSISNSIGVNCWNSYTNIFSDPVQILAVDQLSMQITNDAGGVVPLEQHHYGYQFTGSITTNYWPGYNQNSGSSFMIPLLSSFTFMSNCDFYFGTAPPGATVVGFYPDSNNYGWESNKFDLPFPNYGLLTTNRLRVVMLDGSTPPYHVIDYVQLGGPDTALNISATVQTNLTSTGFGPNMWSKATDGNQLPYGIKSQIEVSTRKVTSYPNGTTYWPENATMEAQIDGFSIFMGLSAPYGSTNSNDSNIQAIINSYTNNYVAQTPYTPVATVSSYTSWQANDPLVHYLASDLNFIGTESGSSGPTTGNQISYGKSGDMISISRPNYSTKNDRYQPWGTQNTNALSQIGVNAINMNPYNLTCKDPLVWASDNWDFPTNKYPAVGWIGRVHRGTPWQTVYLKANNVLHILDAYNDAASGTNTWAVWSGNYNAYDANNSAPLQDRLLFDVFTASPNDNAARGTLSVNAGAGLPDDGLAAWSALFSGVVVITNTLPYNFQLTAGVLPPAYSWLTVQPAGANGFSSALGNLVTNISNSRTSTNYGGAFRHKGDILSTLALTEQSPFLDWTNTTTKTYYTAQQKYGISDEAYEWLPQQVMGLLRLDTQPRYVIYSFGQTLKPAPAGTVLNSSYYGLVTNYQVVAESATRAVVTVQPTVTNAVVNGVTVPVTNYQMKVENFNVLPPQ